MTKKNMAAAGLSVVLSYGFVSNINSCTMMAWVWAKYVKDTGLSPLMWSKFPPLAPKFLAYYGAVYVTIGSALRPFRAALAGVISPFFNKMIDFLMNELKFPKWLAILTLVFTFNIVLTVSWLMLMLKVSFFVLKVPPIVPVPV
eukprot:CAMPEP_0172586134 /NCGR_PEP_ID=MMETSP1068-20121228/5511_1 /TAXON_ID=35684 /ORGANISM="Pseudopedinella elastica, Strain CCMP716" /LENGTH=143 /DNA_ID=CAMNT_0013380833 /DNA_START=329 /DNA_END=760 /DNA_ORIENTATION=+